MSVNIEDPLAYEMLSRTIDEFEKGALNTGKREAFLAVANGPLTGMETALDGSERVISDVQSARTVMAEADEDGFNIEKLSPAQVIENKGIQFDEDLLEVFGGPDNPVKNYLEECLGCSLRLNFDWQLKPLALLGPINAFLDLINDALDKLLGRIDPFNILKEICWALNHLKLLCPADLLLVLMALKMLLKKYILNLFNIKIDWTILLGPLLKFIVDAITSLLEQIVRIILAPIDCVLSGLKTANELLKGINEFLGTAKAFGEGLGDLASDIGKGEIPGELDGGLTVRDAQWISPADGVDENGVPDPGRLDVDDRFAREDPATNRVGADEQTSGGPLSFPTGFEVKGDMTLSDAFADPAFPNATFLEKLIVPIQEARNWIRDLFDNIIAALRSLNGLVGGSLALNLDMMGILIFIADMIGLVMMIIRLLKMNLNITDWCSYLQENPELLEEQLRGTFGEDLHIEPIGKASEGNAGLLMRQGPTTVGVINTCSDHRSDADSQIINQWIADLKTQGI